MNDAPQNITRFFDRKAKGFDAIYSGRESFMGRTWDRLTRRNIPWRLRFAMEALSPVEGKRVLDVGCGSGRYCVELAARGAAEAVGVDLSPRMIELADALALAEHVDSRCRFLQVDVRAYRPEVTFDAALAMGFFDYVMDPLPVMRHLAVMAGTIVASFPALWSPRVPFRKMWLKLCGCPVKFYTRRQIRDTCARAGLTCRQLLRDGPIYVLVAASR